MYYHLISWITLEIRLKMTHFDTCVKPAPLIDSLTRRSYSIIQSLMIINERSKQLIRSVT